jgi:hypothetical protein
MKKIVLICTAFLLSCAASQSIIVPAGDVDSYKKTMSSETKITRQDTLRGPDGIKMIEIHFIDSRQ